MVPCLGVGAISIVLGFFEITQDVLVGPAWVAQFLPSVVVSLITADVEHVVEHAAAAENLATWPVAAAILQACNV